MIGATRQDIVRGRSGLHQVLPQSAFLIGDRRENGDIQPCADRAATGPSRNVQRQHPLER